jgi:hypothetical protein
LDGTNTLTLIGSESCIAELKDNGLCFLLTEADPEEFRTLQRNYFGHANIKIIKNCATLLQVAYGFRNRVPVEYLKRLMADYPKLWLKNEHYIEDNGHCGVWIARKTGNVVEIQEAGWVELSIEEL